MTTARVLFVDDEQRILDGLRRSLRGKRGEWDMSFATSGTAALDRLSEAPHDVVVSDMRMPGMDGAELLTHVSHRHPQVARVVLSGHTEPEAAIRAAVAGHRFLTKPSDPEEVTGIIQQLTARTSAGDAAHVRRIAGGVRALPSLPRHADRLTELLQASHLERGRVSRAALHDIGFTAKLLQLSGSAFFGVRTHVATVDSVVKALGIPTVRALAQAARDLWSTVALPPATEQHLEATWRHAAATAQLVWQLASPASRPYAEAAALLQDVGRFACLSTDGRLIEPAAGDDGVVPYRDVGVDLLHLWGLPAPVVAAVAERDAVHRPDPSGLGVTGAVRTAHLLVQHTESADPTAGTHEEELAALLNHPQLTAQGTDWRRAAEEASTRAGEWSPV